MTHPVHVRTHRDGDGSACGGLLVVVGCGHAMVEFCVRLANAVVAQTCEGENQQVVHGSHQDEDDCLQVGCWTLCHALEIFLL